MRKWILRIIVLIVLVAAYPVLRATVFAPEPIPVRVVTVDRGRVESTVTNSKAGTVKVRRRSRLSPETGGRVVEIVHREGDVVAEGDVLIRLDDSSQRAQLALARRTLEAARASYEQAQLTAARARSELDRQRNLFDKKLISDDFLEAVQLRADEAKLLVDVAVAQVEKARASLDVAQVELDKTVLRAPFGGVLGEVSTELGEWITPSPPMLPVPPVIDIIDPSSIYVSAPIDEVDSAAVRVGQRVRVSIDSYRDREFAGRVMRIAPFVLDIEQQNRTVEIEVQLDDETFAASLLPGTSADVEVLLEVREDALRIPAASLIHGDTVLEVEGGELVEQRVEIGMRNWAYVEILSGLTAGERIVSTLDRAEIVAGARVTVDAPSPETPRP